MELITAFPWYTDRSKQNRFLSYCDKACPFQLITDRHSLPPFMIRRLSSCAPISSWILRCPTVESSCTDIVVDGGFSFGTPWTTSSASIGSGVVSVASNQTGAYVTQPAVVSGCYKVSITISNLIGADTKVWVSIGGALSAEYTTNGVQTFIIAAGVLPEITVFATTDRFGSVQFDDLVVCRCFEAMPGDIDLDKTLLNITTIEVDGIQWDYIYYCGGDLGQVLDCGTYESIINSDTTYYSELITVKDFESDTSPYLLIEWYNTCDLAGLYYSDCFYNRLWLDAVVAEPSYPIEESGQNNGENKFIPTFQKWQKVRSIQTGEVPEYLVDALTLMKLHDNVNITYPLRTSAVAVDAAVAIESINPKVSWLFQGCTANVAIDFIQDEVVVDSACCTPMTVVPCKSANYNVIDALCDTELPMSASTYHFTDDMTDDLIWTGDGTIPTNKWEVSSGVGMFDNSGAGSNQMTSSACPAFVQGASYSITYTVQNVAGGFVQPRINGTFGITRSTVGTFTETIVAGSVGGLQFFGSVGALEIDDIIIYRVLTVGDQYLVFNDCATFEGSVYTWNGTGWDIANNIEGDIVQAGNESAGLWWYYNGDFWYQVPSVASVIYDPNTGIASVAGYILPGTCAQIYFSTVSASSGFVAVGTPASTEQLAAGYAVLIGLPCGTPFWIRFFMQSWNCTYRVSLALAVTNPC